ncbi:hypothetical protein ACTMTI_53620 [Nonomuraea sp. H19]
MAFQAPGAGPEVICRVRAVLIRGFLVGLMGGLLAVALAPYVNG